MIANLKNTLEGVIPGLNDFKYGIITVAFQLAYGIAMVVAGGLTDKLGTRKAFAIAICLWSVAAMLPGAAFSVASFALAMFLLGLGEAANFPACIKTVAEWFPKRERAYATGIFNSGANVGNMVAPVVVTAFVALFSQWSFFGPANAWRGTFVVAGALGFVWLVFWLTIYRRPEEHPRVSKAELALILSDPGEKIESVPWSHVVPCKEAWAFAVAKFLTDPIWWFYLFWIPGYLQTTFHLSLSQSRIPVMLAYAISIVGSVGGGWISGALINRGIDAESGPQRHDAALRTVHRAHLCRAVYPSPLGGRGAAGPGYRRSPGMVGDIVHAALRYVSQGRGGQRYRHRRHGGRDWRSAAVVQRGSDRSKDAQLCIAVYHCVPCLPVALLIIHAISPRLAPANAALRLRMRLDSRAVARRDRKNCLCAACRADI